MSLGDFFFTLRQKAQMSPEDLASRAKVSLATVYNIEGNKNPPSLGTIRKYAKAFNVDAGMIFNQVLQSKAAKKK